MKRKKPAGWKYKKERQNYYKNKGYKDEPFDEGITETFTKTGVRKRTTPEGKIYCTNVKLKSSDLELMETLKNMNS